MKISVMGLGYVGVVSAACLAKAGHKVIGVDPEQVKVDLINGGNTPIVEKDIGPIIKDQVANGRLRATTNPAEAIRNSDLFFVCVGTPSLANGGIDLTYVRRVCEQIGAELRHNAAAPNTDGQSPAPSGPPDPATCRNGSHHPRRHEKPVPGF